MVDLTNFAKNPFDGSEIGLDRFLAFTTDHLERMRADDAGGLLAARVAATALALEAVNSHTSADSGTLGQRKSRKSMMRSFRKALPGKIADITCVVIGKFGLNAPDLTQCFPKGRRVLARCSDDTVSSHIRVLIAALTARQAVLGAGVVAQAELLQTQWQSVYDESESSAAKKASAEKARRDARSSLQLELFLNLLAIVQAFPRQPEAVKRYMRQSLLGSR